MTSNAFSSERKREGILQDKKEDSSVCLEILYKEVRIFSEETTRYIPRGRTCSAQMGKVSGPWKFLE